MAARSESRIFTAIWRDPSFLSLPPNAKLLWLALVTSPELSPAGTLPYLPVRWANKIGWTQDDAERASDDLRWAAWLIADEQVQECFVSGYFASEKVGRQPRRVIAAQDALRFLQSERVAAFASAELAELIDAAVPPVPRGIRALVLERDSHKCQQCGWKPGDPVPVSASGRDLFRVLELDHIHPRSKGGSDDAANFQVLCTSCNARKGDRI